MEYQVLQIKSKKDIASCNTFYIDNFNWGGDYRPVTYGQLGLIKDSGFFIKFICLEKNPTRIYTKQNDPVYKDSAVEAFFCFTPEYGFSKNPSYLNFEMNANGAFLVKIGKDRFCRESLPDELCSLIVCTPKLTEDRWEIELFIPLSVLNSVYPLPDFYKGSHFTCNFYKLQESGDEFQHFASFSPITTEEPNFHLPEYFADAVIV